jgi:hypothetical protein
VSRPSGHARDFIRWGAAFASLIALTCAAPAVAFDHAAAARAAYTRHILPGYERFDSAARAFADRAAALCRDPSPAALQATRDAARAALLAWGHIEHIRFGPITKEHRIDRLLFYPDTRGIAPRQIARLLNHHDDADIAAAKLAQASVAVQGFTAVDYALFGPGSDKLSNSGGAAFRCRYVSALADGIAKIAAGTLGEWSGAYKATWLEPGGDNATYLSASETSKTLLRAYVTELEAIRLQRLAPMLTAKDGGARAHSLFPESGLGLPFILANTEGVRDLLTEGGFTDPALAADEQEQTAMGILESVVTDLGFALRAGNNAMAGPPEGADTADANARLAPLVYSLKNAEETGRSALGALTGQSLGFNSLDGD